MEAPQYLDVLASRPRKPGTVAWMQEVCPHYICMGVEISLLVLTSDTTGQKAYKAAWCYLPVEMAFHHPWHCSPEPLRPPPETHFPCRVDESWQVVLNQHTVGSCLFLFDTGGWDAPVVPHSHGQDTRKSFSYPHPHLVHWFNMQLSSWLCLIKFYMSIHACAVSQQFGPGQL